MIAIVVAYILAAIAVARRADARFRDEARLPMQWWLNGEVTWTAPRVLALATMPATGSIALIAYVVLAATQAPRPGDEPLVMPVLIGLAALFLALQLLHLWFVARTLRRAG